MAKKITAMLVIAFLCIRMLTACSTPEENPMLDADGEDRLKVVCTIFPAYDWVCQIAGEEVEAVFLMDTGVDLHSYQPSAADFVTIAECDVLIYVGGESEDWMEAALRNSVNENMQVINMMELLDDAIQEEAIVEGMQEETHWFGRSEELEYDEHIWLSLRNAEMICNAITDALVQADEAHAEYYRGNNTQYQQKLMELDQSYEDMIEKAEINVLLFGDRFPFRYLTEDYGLNYYAAFPGCSAETEASFETITFLSGKMDEYELPGVLILEKSSPDIAQAIIDNTTKQDQAVLVLDSIQSVNRTQIEEGISYLSIMEKNRDVLGQALRTEE